MTIETARCASLEFVCVFGQDGHRRNPPTGVSKMLDFLGLERTVEDRALTVGEPFLENLVASQFVAPDGSRDVAPEGAGIEIHVERRLTR